MVHPDLTQLDNPLWYALNGAQKPFSTGSAQVKRYKPGILPFAAYDHRCPDQIASLNGFLDKDDIFFLVGVLPSLPLQWQLVKEFPCEQMVLEQSVPIAQEPATRHETASVTSLTGDDKDAMFELIYRVQPGYYERDTHQLGNYFGIWQDGRLVAIAGERMRLDGMVEISAVCTDPAFTGRGYAQQLVMHLSRTNLENGNLPFLHVLTSNERAIRLYERLGFRRRRLISFWKLRNSGA
jgi:ribosomal protein S18 acetylase RimI-like enzyme